MRRIMMSDIGTPEFDLWMNSEYERRLEGGWEDEE